MQMLYDGPERPAFVMSIKSTNILKQESLWAIFVYQPFDLEEERSTRITKALTLTCIREWLARKPCQHQVEGLNFGYLTNIPLRILVIVEFVCLACSLVYLTRKHAS